jgi:hypothetical protein
MHWQVFLRPLFIQKRRNSLVSHIYVDLQAKTGINPNSTTMTSINLY